MIAKMADNWPCLPVRTRGHPTLVIYYPIASKFHLWTTFIKLLLISEYGFCPMNLIMIIKVVAKTDMPLTL